jgi:hypothetical protein
MPIGESGGGLGQGQGQGQGRAAHPAYSRKCNVLKDNVCVRPTGGRGDVPLRDALATT